MAYEWTTGETITAVKLNATGGGMVIPEFTQTGENSLSCDMTYAEIEAAIAANQCVVARAFGSYYWLDMWEEDFTIQFARTAISNGVIRGIFSIEPDETVTYWEDTYFA